jgi:hypothetical protein
MPSVQQQFTVQLQVAHDIANLMGRKPGIQRYSHIMKPQLYFTVFTAHMNVRRFLALI